MLLWLLYMRLAICFSSCAFCVRASLFLGNIRSSLSSWDMSLFNSYLLSGFWNLKTARLISTLYLVSIFQNAKTGSGAERGNWESKSWKEVSSGSNRSVLYFLSFTLLFGLWGNLKLCCVTTSANHIVRAECSISRMETALCEEYGDSICVCRAWDTNRFVQKRSCWKVKKKNLVFTSLYHSRVVFKRKTETCCGFCFRGWNLEEKLENVQPLQSQWGNIAGTVSGLPLLTFTDSLSIMFTICVWKWCYSTFYQSVMSSLDLNVCFPNIINTM